MAAPRLPLELRLEILSYLRYDRPKYRPRTEQFNGKPTLQEHDARRVALWALTLTDRLWNELATPLLYESFIPTMFSLPLLLQTLLDKPELGLYTTSLGLYDEYERISHQPLEYIGWDADVDEETDRRKVAIALEHGSIVAEAASKPFGFMRRKEARFDWIHEPQIYTLEDPWHWAFTVSICPS